MKFQIFRNVLLLAIAIFTPVAGYYVAERFGEPYPWLIMPGFDGNQIGKDGLITTTRIDVEIVFADQTKEELSLKDFFSPMHGATASSLFRHILTPNPANQRPEESIKTASASSKFSRMKQSLQPGYFSRERNRQPAYPYLDTVVWLSNRTVQLFPDRQAQALRFRSEKKYFSPSGTLLTNLESGKALEAVFTFDQE